MLLIQDIKEAANIWRFWLRLSWLDFYGWYGRMSLGLAWVFISPILFSAGISAVYSEAFNQPFAAHFLYVYGGYVCWLFLADTVSQGAEVYEQSYSYYSEIKLPIVGFNIKGSLLRSYGFLLNSVVYALVSIFAGKFFNPINFLIVAIYLFLYSVMMSIVLSIVLAYFKDLKLIIQNLMRLLFFLTPIVWVPGEKLEGVKAILVYANPFFYVVDAYRQVNSAEIGFNFIEVHLAILATLTLVSFCLYQKFARKMVFVCK